MRLALIFALVCVAAIVMACGGDDDDGPSPSPAEEGGVCSSNATGSNATGPNATCAPRSATASPTPTPGPTDTATPVITRNLPGLAPGQDPQGDQLLYLALGDSLSEGIGARDEKRDAWVPLVASALGPQYELLNLGVAGDDSFELIEDGPLDHGLQEIATRANDGIPGNEIAVITLEIGGNDLLDLYDSLVLTGDCPSVVESLERQECIDGLQNALDAYRPNLAHTIEVLQEAAPGVPIFLMTLYNPFSGGARTLDEIGVLALEGQSGTPFAEGLNDGIRAEAEAHPGVVLVEWYDLFLDKQSEYISQDLIHPNNTGHAVMADAVLAAMVGVELP